MLEAGKMGECEKDQLVYLSEVVQEGTMLNQQQGHGQPKLIDAHGDHVVQSN